MQTAAWLISAGRCLILGARRVNKMFFGRTHAAFRIDRIYGHFLGRDTEGLPGFSLPLHQGICTLSLGDTNSRASCSILFLAQGMLCFYYALYQHALPLERRQAALSWHDIWLPWLEQYDNARPGIPARPHHFSMFLSPFGERWLIIGASFLSLCLFSSRLLVTGVIILPWWLLLARR